MFRFLRTPPTQPVFGRRETVPGTTPAPARAMFALLLACAALFDAGPARAAAPEDFKWDLSYRRALERHPIPATEFTRMWAARLEPDRPIIKAMSAYAGAPVQAALLIEKPDGHAGDPVATWFIKTAAGASVCTYHRQIEGGCEALDPVRAEQFMRDVMRFPELTPQKGRQVDEGGAGGPSMQVNYLGFLSVYVDGVALQRPIGAVELTTSATGGDPQAGRLDRAFANLVLSPEEARKRQDRVDADARQQRFSEAAVGGDPAQLRRLLEQPGAPAPDLDQALALAAANNRHRAVDFLLERGAKIDANDSAALKAAIQARDKEMVRHLIERGAKANLVQSTTVLSTAVGSGDPALVELVLRAGAKPEAPGATNAETPLIQLVRESASRTRGTPDAAKAEAADASIAQQLIAAGANVNALGAHCTTAYGESLRQGGGRLTELLRASGADPGLHERCLRNRQLADKGSRDGAEARARSAISDAVVNALRAHDYAKLDTLYAGIRDPRQVTPAGRSKLAIFYYALRTYPQYSREAAYWRKMQAEAAAWKTKNPRSIPGRMFEVYMHLRRTESFRGNGYYNTLNAQERAEVDAGSEAAFRALIDLGTPMKTARDPEWDRAMLNVLPYSRRYSTATMGRYLRDAAERYPNYEDLYFTAAWYQVPDYLAMPDARDLIARQASARPGKDAAALYARVYWYLDQMDYHGKLFETGFADWPTMRTSFASLVAQYPDPWNLNAYAYYACLAGDYATMAELLTRIGDDLVGIAWGQNGADTYTACAAHAAEGDAAGRARFDAAQPEVVRKRLARVFFEFIRFGTFMRNNGDLETSLAALRRAEDIDRQLGRRPSMMAQYHLGRTLARMGRHEAAIETYTIGLRAQPEYEEAYYRRGQSYAALGRHAEARQDYATGARYFSRHPVAELAALKGDDKASVQEMLKAFREAGFATPDF